MNIDASLDSFNNRTGRHTPGSTQGCHSGFQVTTLHFVKQGPQNDCTCGTNGMTQGHGTAINIHLLAIEIQVTNKLFRNHSKGLVNLPKIYISNIEAAMSSEDPENAAIYRANAEAYSAQMRETIEPLRTALADVPEDKRWLVTCEGAFSYLARDFGLKELYLWPMNADQVGTPQQVRKVIDGVRDNDIEAVFCESTVSDAPAKQVARETGSVYGGVLYVDSLSAADGPVPTYLDLLTVTSQTIVDALTKDQ